MTIGLDKVVEDLTTKAVNKLVQTVAANIELVRGIDSAIMDLTTDIETFNARLVDVSKNPGASELQVLKVVVKRFRNVVNEAQDAVAKYIALTKKHEEYALAKCFDKIPVPVCGNVNVCASEIRSIRTKVNTIRQDHEKDLVSLMNYQNNGKNNGQLALQARPVVEEDYVMGFEDDLKTIKDRLTEASDNFIVIPIVGMPGTGKTTFANQIFKDPDILDKFANPIWVHVSQSFDRKQKFIDILDQIAKRREDFSMMSEDRLEDNIKDLLKDKKYFIIMDDIWEKEDWDSLKVALPENLEGSRVLVTTRYCSVADCIGESHILQKLEANVSWSLLEKKVFGKEGCRIKSLRPLGEEIAKRCNGLPLALVMIAGILRKSRTPADWKRVAGNPFLEINRKDQSYHKLVMLSYDHLPHEKLRNCFLYFASFPMGHEVAAWKLIRLWIAEEFIPTIDEWGYTLDLEVEAHNYLKDLVDRNLVMVMKRRADGQIKTCRIHDSLHEFCKSEAAKKNLFYVMNGGQRLDANTISSRRLCFHSSINDVFDEENNPSRLFHRCFNKKRSPFPLGEHVHSLLMFSSQKSEIHLTQEQLAIIPSTFPLLRVLDIESLKLSMLPDELYGLYLLRYLAITTDFNLLPSRFKNLRELETLVFKTTENTLEIDGGIWNMEKLRHMHTNTSAQLPYPPKSSSGSTNIRTLSTISPTSCKKEIFSKTPKLQKLGVRGNLAELLEEKQGICLFNNLQMLDCLESLKLHGQSDKVLKVPKLNKFPRRLRKLTLSNTLFGWNGMSILGSLDELEVLKLDENAFTGKLWDLKSDVVFRQLQYLRIGRTNLVTWIAAKNSFPALESLVLRNCTVLEEIPNAFADLDNLKEMELFHVSERAANSARKIHERRHDRKDDAKTRGFNLFITSLPSQAPVHELTQGEKNVNTSKFNLPSTSVPSQAMAPILEEPDVVGFEEEVEIIKDRLIQGSKNLSVISIVGVVGLGKTTLTGMLFGNHELQYEFFTRLWVNVSKTFNRRQIFLDILHMLTNKANEYDNLVEVQLAHKIQEFLEGGKYFIIMDDVWTVQDWDCLKIAFPKNMRGSRVLVTTRHHEVALCVDSAGNPHQLKFLRDEESWKLLEKKIFHNERCPSLFEPLGKCIATKCNGVPLALVLIADVLDKKKTPEEWRQIAEDPFAIIDLVNQEYNPLIQLIYDKMDFQLRDCFLYLAAFPIGHEIAAWKLIRLWIAEGFIPLTEGEYTSNLERTAEKYLEDLVDKKVLTALKRKADGQIKTCRIRDTLHQFCKTEAANKNIFHEMDGAKLDINEIPHRLCAHSSVLEFLESESKPSSKHVRSFLSICSEEIDILDEHLATIPKSFPILMVMDIESLNLKSLPKQLYHLYHLRYLAISTDLEILPELFNNFWNLQTLVFNTSQTSLKVTADIWNMPKLRHLHSNTSMQLPPLTKIGKNSSESTYMQTLSTISPSSCTVEILDKTPYLQKLGIRGNLDELMEGKGGISLFDNLQKLCHLENLKMLNEAIHGQASILRSVPQHDKFPQKLRKLTLSNTLFKWKDMYILGALDELEVLKLEDYAFTGESWELNDDIVFKQLQFLRIGRTDLVYWKTSNSCFPVLTTLELRYCTSLNEVPAVFGDVDSLMVLELYHTNEKAENSAWEIQRLKHENGNTQSGGFELSINLPDI